VVRWLLGVIRRLWTRPPVGAAGADVAALHGHGLDRREGDRLLRLLGDAAAAAREEGKRALRSHGTAALPVLLRGLDDPRDEAAAASAELLGALEDERAVAPLLQALKYSRRTVQLAAARALAATGPAAVPALREALSETQPWVRRQIEAALAAAEAARAGDPPAR
jgi:HEAT repeat protein